MPHTRRTFLSWLGGTSLLAGMPSRLAAGAPSPEDATPHAPPVAETWDMSWTGRVTGRYKAVFDSPELSGGAALYRAVWWCEHYKEVYGVARSDMTAVVVLRHAGFFMAMNDEFWSVVNLGKARQVRDAQGKKWAKVSPVGAAAAAATPSEARFTLPNFIADGGIALACGWTFGGAASMLAKAEKLEMPAARERARTLLVPGVILQPNGIFAALRAQEAGCSYINAS
ncbi:MAG: hypothetical protein IT355_18600 [Gemmatimonadaceae bacterium]|nr:hypothetical protein [Gemmatimonadaceae bacterium]